MCEAVEEDYVAEMLQYSGDRIEWNQSRPSDEVGELGNRKSHARLRAWQINQPLFDGRGRWEAELSGTEKERIKELAQHQLVRFGYAEDDRC